MASSASGALEQSPVILNVYDLASYNGWAYWCGLGVYHAGVEVYGEEYAYGGHLYDYSGVFATAPRDAPGEVVWRESVLMGTTNLSRVEVHQLVQKLGQEYRGNRYHLLQRNCNHFASDLCKQLVGKPTPGWVNRLAGMAIALHCLLPSSWLPPLEALPSAKPTIPPASTDKDALFTGVKSDEYADRRQPTPMIMSADESDVALQWDTNLNGSMPQPSPQPIRSSR